MQAQVDAAKAEADGSAPTVLFLRAGSNGVKVKNSKDTVLGAMLADLEAVNIADSDTALLEDLSLEQIMADDPQYIFAVYQGSDQDAAQKVMEQAGVTAWADRDLRELSGGQRQRVYLAMTLAQGGQTILLDEPTTYLDTAAQFQLMELLQSLAQQGRTVVMVLHDLAHAMQYSDAVGVFADGKLAAFAEPSQLYEQKIWEEVFQVKLCKALDGTYYIKPLERTVLFHAVAPIVSKTGLL